MCKQTDVHVIKFPLHCAANKTNREICVLFDTVYSPAFPPTQPTYTIHPHTRPEILLTQTDSSKSFYSFFSPSVCSELSMCDEVDTKQGILFLTQKSPLWIIAGSFARHIIKQTQEHSSCCQTLRTALKRKAGITSDLNLSLCSSSLLF